MVDIEDDIKNCLAILKAGGVILYPTDTVWGLGCDALNQQAVEKIYSIKQRPKEKSLIVLLADAKDVLQYAATPPPDIISIIEAFDRPTTVIYENALEFPFNVVNGDGSIAIRVTNEPFCKTLIKRFRRPIISTSANISGMPTPAIFNLIDDNLKKSVDYIVKYRQNDETIHAPSRLVKMDDEGNIQILRA